MNKILDAVMVDVTWYHILWMYVNNKTKVNQSDESWEYPERII